MKITSLKLECLKIIEPDVYKDQRGYFLEIYNKDRYNQFDINCEFIQDNESLSSKGVIRGLHWQKEPYTQAKLVRVIKGSVWDIAVDVRKDSPTFGKWESVILSEDNKKQFFIPRGFAHGFIALEDNTIFSYKCDNLYNKESECGLNFMDPDLKIQYPKLDCELIFNEKDKKHPYLKNIIK